MAILKDIEVVIVRFPSGTTLSPEEVFEEYERPVEAPEGLEDDDCLIERYIKARTGFQFQVAVFVKPEFELCGAQGIKIIVTVDGRVVNQNPFNYEEMVSLARTKQRPLFLRRAIWPAKSKEDSEKVFQFKTLEISKPFVVTSC